MSDLLTYLRSLPTQNAQIKETALLINYYIPRNIITLLNCYSLYHYYLFNPYLTNGLSNHYQLGESTFILGDIRGDFRFLFTFSMIFLQANRIVPDGTQRSAAAHLGLFCLPMSNKRDARNCYSLYHYYLFNTTPYSTNDIAELSVEGKMLDHVLL